MTVGRGTVLVVDGRPGVRGLLRDCLGGAGFEVLECADGEAALGFCARYEGPIDLLIADLFLSGEDHFGLAQQARRIRPSLQAILLGGPDERRRSDGVRVLPRPFTLSTLLRRVQKILSAAPRRAAG